MGGRGSPNEGLERCGKDGRGSSAPETRMKTAEEHGATQIAAIARCIADLTRFMAQPTVNAEAPRKPVCRDGESRPDPCSRDGDIDLKLNVFCHQLREFPEPDEPGAFLTYLLAKSSIRQDHAIAATPARAGNVVNARRYSCKKKRRRKPREPRVTTAHKLWIELAELVAEMAQPLTDGDMARVIEAYYAKTASLAQIPSRTADDIDRKVDVLCLRLREFLEPDDMPAVVTYLLAESIRQDIWAHRAAGARAAGGAISRKNTPPIKTVRY